MYLTRYNIFINHTQGVVFYEKDYEIKIDEAVRELHFVGEAKKPGLDNLIKRAAEQVSERDTGIPAVDRER